LSLTGTKGVPFRLGWRYQPGLKVLYGFFGSTHPLWITFFSFVKYKKNRKLKIMFLDVGRLDDIVIMKINKHEF
jgi:hypothetical protein